jgi:hypothetical protein
LDTDGAGQRPASGLSIPGFGGQDTGSAFLNFELYAASLRALAFARAHPDP